ncbi:MAG: hypothetical protein AYK19_03585 [Theionarchaea archaeon DG-70-1]|nr:MAG: hypothetical protein AYK19_03585 [Theionarchaea archaeon DG-70-1]
MIGVSLQEDADVARVGGKAANLMKLKRFNIPDGICITIEAYDLFCEKNGLKDKIADMVTLIDYDDTKSVEKASKKIRKTIFEAKIPKEIKEAIKSVHYEHVAVRSSAELEDLPEASFAGQQETYINPASLEDAVKRSL